MESVYWTDEVKHYAFMVHIEYNVVGKESNLKVNHMSCYLDIWCYPLFSGMQISHLLCGNVLCVLFDHLFYV